MIPKTLLISLGCSLLVHGAAVSVISLVSGGAERCAVSENRSQILEIVAVREEVPERQNVTPSSPPAPLSSALPEPVFSHPKKETEPKVSPMPRAEERPPTRAIGIAGEVRSLEVVASNPLTDFGPPTNLSQADQFAGIQPYDAIRENDEHGNSPAGYLHTPKPEYPKAARKRKQEGLVLLDVVVTEDGLATDIELKQSSGYKILDEAALAAVRHWKFTPAQDSGKSIESRADVPIRFQLKH